jgi:hypothetical protein
MAMSMILDRTLSMRCPSVRQSSAIRWLVESVATPSANRGTPRRRARPAINLRDAKLIEPVRLPFPFPEPEIA